MSEQPLYNPEIVMKVEEKIKELFIDLIDALQWRHLQLNRQKELLKKYGMKPKSI